MPGQERTQFVGHETSKSAVEPEVGTDLLKSKEPLLVVGIEQIISFMRVAICRAEEAGHPLITDSAGEVYLFDLRGSWFGIDSDFQLVVDNVPSRSEILAERRQMEVRINHGKADPALRFVPVDACFLAKAPRGSVYTVFNDGEQLCYHGKIVSLAIGRVHGERTFETYPDKHPITEKFVLPRDTVVVPFCSTENTPLRGGWL